QIDQGSAYLFVKPVGGWVDMHETAILTASDGFPNDHFGTSAALSGDTVLVGANGVASKKGAAYIFAKPVGGWESMIETAKLTALDGALNDSFGWSVALSGDTVLVS